MSSLPPWTSATGVTVTYSVRSNLTPTSSSELFAAHVAPAHSPPEPNRAGGADALVELAELPEDDPLVGSAGVEVLGRDARPAGKVVERDCVNVPIQSAATGGPR